jgi:hypothetical protein
MGLPVRASWFTLIALLPALVQGYREDALPGWKGEIPRWASFSGFSESNMCCFKRTQDNIWLNVPTAFMSGTSEQ